MKTTKIIVFIIATLLCSRLFSQTIGVTTIKTFNLYATAETAATISRLELTKLNTYKVLDRFDMEEVDSSGKYVDCYGQNCLIDYGKLLQVDYLLSGSIDGLGNKIVITLKLIDVNSEKTIKTQTAEFENQEVELQRMLGIVIKKMHDQPIDEVTYTQLAYKNDVIVSNNIGRVNNSGPRLGVAYTVGDVNEFMTRDERYGGLDISPVLTNIGYQFEGQYVGTENFSALFEGIFNFSALEQGQFIPSFALLNGFRFGKKGWEFAFGPSFGLQKTSVGFFTENGKDLLGGSQPRYWTETEYNNSTFSEISLEDRGYEYGRFLDKRGRLDISTRWIMAVGRTFRSGGLNIPVNIYYSSQKGGGMAGISVGFNVTRLKSKINE